MNRPEPLSRRTLLTAAAATAGAAALATTAGTAVAGTGAPARAHAAPRLVDNRAWTSHSDWRSGTAKPAPARSPGPAPA